MRFKTAYTINSATKKTQKHKRFNLCHKHEITILLRISYSLWDYDTNGFFK